ncbi:hypothetical protein JTE90_027515 [Oedothorax gibbosus]|uniref:Uncharacterized protein n=1 Tax=Oedothorax gibbosus TaxID=931172 RepID=A0AAV6VLJ6_9ARAC|nr:hypothetical protein JTE90_027515 [Oedothorax gibbosus]
MISKKISDMKRGLLKRSRALTMETEDRIGLFKTSLKSLPEYESVGLDPTDLAAEEVRPFPSIPDRMLKHLGLFGVFVEG